MRECACACAQSMAMRMLAQPGAWRGGGRAAQARAVRCRAASVRAPIPSPAQTDRRSAVAASIDRGLRALYSRSLIELNDELVQIIHLYTALDSCVRAPFTAPLHCARQRGPPAASARAGCWLLAAGCFLCGLSAITVQGGRGHGVLCVLYTTLMYSKSPP